MDTTNATVVDTANPATRWVAMNLYNGFTLGFYASKELAEAAVEFMKTRPGRMKLARRFKGDVEIMTETQMRNIYFRLQASRTDTDEEAEEIINYILGPERLKS